MLQTFSYQLSFSQFWPKFSFNFILPSFDLLLLPDFVCQPFKIPKQAALNFVRLITVVK